MDSKHEIAKEQRVSHYSFEDQPIDSSKIIGLCIDIDDTLINYKDSRLSFNGLSHWLDSLSRLKTHLENRGFKLAVHIVSAKSNGNIDITVSMVVKALKPFIKLWRKDGTSIGQHASLSIVFHHYTEHLKKRLLKSSISQYQNDVNDYPDMTDDTLLPSVHICYNNHYHEGVWYPSKAHVLKYISEFYGNTPIPANNMFLLDNSLFNETDIMLGAYATTPIYHFVSAHSLEKFRYWNDETRALLAERILESCLQAIIQRINDILPPEVYTRLMDLLDEVEQASLSVTEESKACVETITLKRTDEHYFVPHQRHLALKRILNTCRFDDHLSFYKRKVHRKLSRPMNAPNSPQAIKTEAIHTLYEELILSVQSLFASSSPINEAKQEFVLNCKNALDKADTHLLPANHRGSFFRGRQSYATGRNALISDLARIKAGNP